MDQNWFFFFASHKKFTSPHWLHSVISRVCGVAKKKKKNRLRPFARQQQQWFVIVGVQWEWAIAPFGELARTHFSPATSSGHISFFALGLYRACVRAPTLIQLSFIVMCAPAGEPFSIIRHTIGIPLSHAMVYHYYVFISFQRYFLLILSNWIRQNLFQYRVQHKWVSLGRHKRAMCVWVVFVWLRNKRIFNRRNTIILAKSTRVSK